MRRPIVFVLLAGVAALVAALVVYSALRQREAQVREAMAQTVQIVVAAHDLPLGTKIVPGSVKMARWSRDSMPPGAFTSPQAVMNSYVNTSMVENEPIVAERLFAGDKTAGVMPLLIPAGMRAVSVPVDEVADIAGFVLPHSRVDVLVAVSSGPHGGTFSKVVLENVEVLAVAQEIGKTKDQPQVVKVVTFLVTPEEAERLTLASREGTLRLAMRNYDDSKIVYTPGVNVQQMLTAYTAAVPMLRQQSSVTHLAVRRPRPKPVRVEVMRNGRSAESVSFIRGGTPQGKGEGAGAPDDTSSSIDPSTKTAKAAEKPIEKDPSPAKAEASKSEGSKTTPAAAAVPSGTAPDSRSKTIDVPLG